MVRRSGSLRLAEPIVPRQAAGLCSSNYSHGVKLVSREDLGIATQKVTVAGFRCREPWAETGFPPLGGGAVRNGAAPSLGVDGPALAGVLRPVGDIKRI